MKWTPITGNQKGLVLLGHRKGFSVCKSISDPPVSFVVLLELWVFPGVYLSREVLAASFVPLEDTLPLLGSTCQQGLLIHNTAWLFHIPNLQYLQSILTIRITSHVIKNLPVPFSRRHTQLKLPVQTSRPS